MFERPIVLSIDNVKNKKLFKNLTIKEHLAVMNKLLNDHYVNIYPAVAIKLIIPQKKRLNAEKILVLNSIIEKLPLLENIKTFEEFNYLDSSNPELAHFIRQYFYKACATVHNQISDESEKQPKTGDSIAINSLYPLLISPHLLDDDHIQLPPNMASTERSKIILSLLTESIKELKLICKKSSNFFILDDSAVHSLMLASQKINAILTFSPHEKHYELIPTLETFAKTLEWAIDSSLSQKNIASLNSEDAVSAKGYKALLTYQLNMLYLFISEAITYHPNDSLEELNYAEWCSDKFYAYHLFGKEDIIENLSTKKSACLAPSKHIPKATIRYFLNRSLIEAKRDSLDLSVSFYKDFIDFVEKDNNNIQYVEMSRCHANLELILKKSLIKPDLFLLNTAMLFERTIPFFDKTPQFQQYKELHALIKKIKFDLFSYLSVNHFATNNHIELGYNLLENSFTLTLPKDRFIKKVKNLKKNPVWIENINFDSRKNTITFITKEALLPLSSLDDFQEVRSFLNYLSKNIQKKQLEKSKPLPSPSPTPLAKITDVVPQAMPVLLVDKPSSVVAFSPVEHEISKLEDKFSQVILEETDTRSRKKSSSPTCFSGKEQMKSEKKSTEKRESQSPEKTEKKLHTEPKIFTAKELGFKHFPDHLVTPIYFGLNQKKKSTNTYAIWDKVANLSTEAEEHFKGFLDPQGITVAKNINDSGVKIHRPPSEKNSPLYAFMRLKSKSKNFGSSRIEAIFEEKALSILPENEDKPIYLYRFGNLRRK